MLLLLQQTKTLIKGIQCLGRDHRHFSASLRSSTAFPCWCSHKYSDLINIHNNITVDGKPKSWIQACNKSLSSTE